MMAEITGTGILASVMRSSEMAQACPRSSAPLPAKAPGVSTSTTTGSPNLAASS